jgi:membrane associated rhomboid family serine protease
MNENDKNNSEIHFPGFEDDGSHYEEVEPERLSGPLSVFPSYRYALPAIAVFFACLAASSLLHGSDLREMFWASGRKVFVEHQYWRLATTIFLHADMQHLLSNTPLLLIFGWFLRAFFGLKIFPLAALGTGIFSNALSLLYYEPDTRLIGASGMVYGMAALWLVYYVRYETGHSLGKKLFRATGFSLALLFPTTFQANVSYIAHGAGYISGLIIAAAVAPCIKINKNVDKKEEIENNY